MAQPVAHSYGKAAVSAYRIAGERLFSCEVELIVGAEALAPSYTEGDNSLVVATDSMKNFVHRAALDFDGNDLEDFLKLVGQRFIDRYEHLEWVQVEGREVPFEKRSGRVLQRQYDDHGFAKLMLGREGMREHRSGRRSLHLLKLSGSSFADFVRDEFTTLPDAYDRPLFVHLDAEWTHSDFERRAPSKDVRDLLVETFAGFDSASIQHLVHEMGVRALERFSQIDVLFFRAENRLWDLVQEGEGARVFTDARPPYGLITLELAR
jgi:urate oxidase / 2-oxo-4-hydroxy-4-carboxy-5-ureidoimidazoline decarboxylase